MSGVRSTSGTKTFTANVGVLSVVIFAPAKSATSNRRSVSRCQCCRAARFRTAAPSHAAATSPAHLIRYSVLQGQRLLTHTSDDCEAGWQGDGGDGGHRDGVNALQSRAGAEYSPNRRHEEPVQDDIGAVEWWASWQLNIDAGVVAFYSKCAAMEHRLCTRPRESGRLETVANLTEPRSTLAEAGAA